MNTRLFFALPALIAPLFAWSVLTVNLQVTHQTCFYTNGAVQALASGGTPPYTYAWNTGATNLSLIGVPAGTYSVTVTDAISDQVTAQVDLFTLPYQFDAIINGMPWCVSPRNAFEDPLVSGMMNTWTVNGMPTTLSGGGYIQFDANMFDSNYSYTVDDGNGCSGTVSGFNGPQITNWPALTITSVEPSCDNLNIGTIDVHAASAVPGDGFVPVVNLFREDGVPVYQAASPDANLDVHFVDLAPGNYGVHWWLGVTGENLDPGTCSYDTVWVTVPSLGLNCGSVQGISYIDLDGDCVQDGNEVGVPYSPLLVQPGNEAVLTNAFGQFAFGLPNGNYTLEQTDPTLVPICPATQPVPFTVNTDLTTIDLANGSTEPLDLRASLSGALFRPGFNGHYHLLVRNDSPQLSGPVTVTLTLDATLTYVSSEVAPVVNGNTLTWDLGAFTSYQWMQWNVTVNVPVGTALGTSLSSTLAVSNTLPDANAANDTDLAVDVVVGSYDPNDKRAQTSTRSSEALYFIDQDEWVDYTIRFQNTGTFPAEFVVITDTMAAELDMLTFEQGVASHPFEVIFKPGRVIEWRFDNINLPDSTSDEAGSHGLVKFRMRPQGPLLPGTVIENTANIFFDYNDPVITEPSVLTAEFSTQVWVQELGQLTIYPNPATDQLRVGVDHGAIVRVRIVSVDGREVLQQFLGDPSGAIDVAHLASGAYVLVAETTDHQQFRKPFSILHP